MSKNSEEVLKIIPTLKTLKKEFKNIGPLVADTIFAKDHKEYDVTEACHDQVLAPFKTLYHFDAINITLV